MKDSTLHKLMGVCSALMILSNVLDAFKTNGFNCILHSFNAVIWTCTTVAFVIWYIRDKRNRRLEEQLYSLEDVRKAQEEIEELRKLEDSEKHE